MIAFRTPVGALLLGFVFLAPLASLSWAVPPDLSYYLPSDRVYDPEIPTPRSVLGYEVGEWHVRHDQLVSYLRTLAASSPRVQVEEYGLTHERRPLLLLTISSPNNLRRLDEIREHHVERALSRELRESPVEGPVVAWMGYSVHGNESSGANASLLVAYHLAAGQGPAMDELLDNAVILLDPCINPDGLSRFAQWANSHRGKVLVGRSDHREHQEHWPSGRTNHYWFDLNRDWLLLTHPESRGRLEKFHRWKPNLLTDFHEMGTNSTYFFQPGVPTRQHPNTPQENLDLTRRIATYHAKILDAAGSLYYTEETFDDFYYGKGSTYPDVNGCIGILFEQASSRGHLQESSFGDLTFPFTIRNQFLTSLSSLEASLRMRESLIEYQNEFYRGAWTLAEKDPIRAYVFGCPDDPSRNHHFVDILSRHQIEVSRLGHRIRQDGHLFEPRYAYVVATAQPQYRLIKALFEKRTEFPDPVFYDVSTWTLPLSFGLAYAELTGDEFTPDLVGAPVTEIEFPTGTLEETEDAYAYLFEWAGYYAPRALNRLLRAEVRARVATRPFEGDTVAGSHRFGYGTIVVPMGVQARSREEIRQLLGTIAAEDGLRVHAVESGLTPVGIDLGSPSVAELKTPVPLLVVGPGVSAYEAGEVWHLLDQRYDTAVSLVEYTRLAGIDLHEYTHIILVSGRYNSLAPATRDRVVAWVRRGGVLIALREAAPWAERFVLGRTEQAPPETKGASVDPEDAAREKSPAARPAYADYQKTRAQQLVSGTIFEATIDVTHPLGFGYRRPTLAVFRSTRTIMKPEQDPLTNVVVYTEEPLLSGYVSAENLAKIRGSSVVCANRLGRGVVIRMIDNPNFRGVWFGTNKIFANAIFFGGVIRNTAPIETEGDGH